LSTRLRPSVPKALRFGAPPKNGSQIPYLLKLMFL